MKTIQTNSGQIDIQELMIIIENLKIPDLVDVKVKIDKLVRKKKPPVLAKKEKELINKIKNGGPSKKIIKRHQELLKKSVQGIMTDEENKEALKLVPIFDKWSLERVQLMLELAKLWDTSLDDVRTRLNIKPAQTVYA